MTNYTKYFFVVLFSATALSSIAQTTATTSSPYSKYGIGDYEDPLLPQSRGMGGMGVATNKTGGFNDINVVNPAAYSYITLTTIDVGAFAGFTSLSKTNIGPQTSSNFRLGHLAFAVPVSKRSALSFGLLPYSNLGYSYRQVISQPINNQYSGGKDTSTVANYKYFGEGGLSKAYIGYGFGLGKHISLGFNIAYVFGNEKQVRSTEFPELLNILNTKVENGFSAGGLNYDYGIQYTIDVNEGSRFTLGYSGSASSNLNTTSNFVVSHYTLSSDGTNTPNIARDSTRNEQTHGKINLPMINRFGITYQKDNKFLIGVDYKMGQWSTLTMGDANAGLHDNQSLAIGGQITPNINALSNYWAVVDYRVGFKYDKTYINVNGNDINQYAGTFGLGLPIPNDRRTSFYKINISAEIGRRGNLENNLVRENYYNFHIGFTINDKWFQKYKFD